LREFIHGDDRWQLDFTGFAGSIESDLARRDFTIDAMAIDLSQLTTDLAGAQIIDLFGGIGDLEQRRIRAVSRTAFIADAVRLLRAVRLAANKASAPANSSACYRGSDYQFVHLSLSFAPLPRM
jgi:tRNA nucleotidyltransferase/poly(A) polymerase